MALRGDNIGALMLPLGTLAPGETKRFVTLLTQQEGTRSESLARARALFEKYRSHETVAAARTAMSVEWDKYLGSRAGEHAGRQHEQHAERAQSAAVLHDQELVA